MKKLLKISVLLLAAVLMLGLAGCPDPDENGGDDIKWTNDASGTLRVINNTNKDMVLFKGQTPSASTILGGVRALSQRDVDISDKVTDYQIGGFDVVRGMSIDEYNANKNALNQAKVDYSAMFTYGRDIKYSVEISPNWTGDYYYRVTNRKNVGIELRLDSPDGEKIGFLPGLAAGYRLYSSSSDMVTVYPVYVFYNRTNQQITTFKPTSLAEMQEVGPRPVTDNSVATIAFPADEASLDTLFDNINYPNAFITVQNNTTRAARFQKGMTYMKAQNGYDNVNSGEGNTFDITSTDAGMAVGLNASFLSGSIMIPVRFEGQSGDPVIKNGYDYTITITGDGNSAATTTATIIEGEKRNIQNLIQSL